MFFKKKSAFEPLLKVGTYAFVFDLELVLKEEEIDDVDVDRLINHICDPKMVRRHELNENGLVTLLSHYLNNRLLPDHYLRLGGVLKQSSSLGVLVAGADVKDLPTVGQIKKIIISQNKTPLVNMGFVGLVRHPDFVLDREVLDNLSKHGTESTGTVRALLKEVTESNLKILRDFLVERQDALMHSASEETFRRGIALSMSDDEVQSYALEKGEGLSDHYSGGAFMEQHGHRINEKTLLSIMMEVDLNLPDMPELEITPAVARLWMSQNDFHQGTVLGILKRAGCIIKSPELIWDNVEALEALKQKEVTTPLKFREKLAARKEAAALAKIAGVFSLKTKPFRKF